MNLTAVQNKWVPYCISMLGHKTLSKIKETTYRLRFWYLVDLFFRVCEQVGEMWEDITVEHNLCLLVCPCHNISHCPQSCCLQFSGQRRRIKNILIHENTHLSGDKSKRLLNELNKNNLNLPELSPPDGWGEAQEMERLQNQWPSESARCLHPSDRTEPTLCLQGSKQTHKTLSTCIVIQQ